jgi:hypothetical protein
MTDGGAWAFVIAAGERTFYIVLVPRRDAKTDHVDQQILAFPPHGSRQLPDALGRNGCGQLLRD